MKKALRLGMTGAVACLTAFVLAHTGCATNSTTSDGGPQGGACAPGSVAQIEQTCVCQVFSDCEAGNSATWACSNGHKCIQTCTSSSDCTVAPATVCENAICLPPACGDDSECSTGQQCVGASCVPAFTASNVASCLVLPTAAVLNAGGSKTFNVVSKDSNGNEIAYKGAVTWGVSSSITGATATAVTGNMAAATVSGSTVTATATGTVTATIGSTTCTPSNVTAFPAPAAGTLRVTVGDQISGTPITNATVEDGSGHALTSNSDGTYSETNAHAGGKNTVSVFASGYSYVTIVDTGATDIYVPLQSTSQTPGKFAGMLTDTDFNNLSIPTGTVHIDISGGSIAGNLIDLSLSTLLGASVPTMINLGGTTATNVNLPDGIAIGLGPTMFKGSYSALGTPGVRSFWSLGGNITLQIVLNAVSMATGGSVDIGAILTSVLPVLGQLESGVTGGVTVTSGEMGTLTTTGNTSGTTAHLALDTLMRLHLSATVPSLPSYYLPTDTPGTPTGQLNGAVVLGGVLADPQGFVPLGLTAGVNDTANNKPTMIAGFMGGPDGVIPLNIAPRNGGLEGYPFLMISLAADLSSLTSGFGDGAVPTQQKASSKPLVLSGNIILPGTLKYQNQMVNSVTFPGTSYLGVPVQPVIYTGSRSLVIPANGGVTGADFYRLDIGSAPNEWEVYFPTTDLTVTVPSLPSGFTGPDLFVGTGSTPPTGTLQSVTLKLATPALTYDQAVGFQTAGVTVDNLTHNIDQFSIIEITQTAGNAP